MQTQHVYSLGTHMLINLASDKFSMNMTANQLRDATHWNPQRQFNSESVETLP